MTGPAKPGILDQLRARFGLLDHSVRAYLHFRRRNGSLLAAGLTYYTLIALFPLLLISFAVGGFALSRRPQLLSGIDDRVRSWVSPELGQQLVDLINSAVAAHASVGVIGLVWAAWVGMVWMMRLREALGRIWDHPPDSAGVVRTLLSDLVAVIWTLVVVLATMVLTALGHAKPMEAALRLLGIPEFAVLDWLFRAISVLISFFVSWLVFSWVIVRLPRESVGVAASMKAGLIAAAGFELFKQLGSIYLRMVLRSPASATFGPVLGLTVFAFVTWLLVLFSAAWAATSDDSRAQHVDPPGPGGLPRLTPALPDCAGAAPQSPHRTSPTSPPPTAPRTLPTEQPTSAAIARTDFPAEGHPE